MLKVFLVQESKDDYLLSVTSSCSKIHFFFGGYLFFLMLESVDDYLQHYLALMANEADDSIVLALLSSASLGD